MAHPPTLPATRPRPGCDRVAAGAPLQDARGPRPSTAALLLLVDAGLHPSVMEELSRFEGIGRVALTTLPEDTKAEVEAALGQQA